MQKYLLTKVPILRDGLMNFTTHIFLLNFFHLFNKTNPKGFSASRCDVCTVKSRVEARLD